MRDVIRESIFNILDNIIEAVQKGDSFALKKWSNYTIHNASIFQDDDSLTIAIVTYSLSKLVERVGMKSEDETILKSIVINLEKMKRALEKDNYDTYRLKIGNIYKMIKKFDAKTSEYVQQVLLKSKIKKGTAMFQHGISLPRVAEAMGITEWDLQEYVGKMEDEHTPSNKALKRLRFAKNLFGV